MKRYISIIPAFILLVVSLPVLSQNPQCGELNINDKMQLCFEVEGRYSDDDESSPFDHRFQRTLWKMAGADPAKDSKDTAKARIQRMWTKYKICFTCEETSFMLPGGNILKYAAQKDFEDFIAFMVSYQLDINFIDPKDGRTVLDFVEDDRKRWSNWRNDASSPEMAKSLYDQMDRMYKFLRSMGALHKRELPK